MEFQSKVSKGIADGETTSEILYSGMRNGGIQILRYLEGQHKYGDLDPEETERTLSTVHQLGIKLKTLPKGLRELHGETLKDKIEKCLESLSPDSIFFKAGKKLQSNSRYQRLIDDEQTLVHYDLHRDNLLFTPDQVKVLDLGSMLYAPEIFLPASLFMSSFLLEGNQDYKQLVNKWPEPLNEEDILILMQARAIIGGAFFESITSPSTEDNKIYERYVNAIKTLTR